MYGIILCCGNVSCAYLHTFLHHQAQEDADLLRSLVEPLEEEIQALKEKIRAQDAQLRAHEAQQAAALHTADVVAPLLQGTDAAQVVQQLDEKVGMFGAVVSHMHLSRDTVPI